MVAVETNNLGKTYENGVEAVKNLSFSVAKGEIFGFLGPNGSGKTTTVRLLNGTLTPSAGSSYVLGIASGDEQVRMKTATLAELGQMYDSLTVEENLLFFANMYDVPLSRAKERMDRFLANMQLLEKKKLKLGSFSTGMKKRVQLVRTLMHDPEIIFLDEPTSGLDPESALQVNDLIKNLASEQGTTVFLCTHNLPLAERICDTFGFIRKGELVKTGKKEELIRSAMTKREVLIRTAEGELRFAFDGESDINRIIRETMDKGKHILEVRMEKPSLEDVYFHYIGRQS